MKEILIGRGLKALVDDEDYDKLSYHRWSPFITKHVTYVVRQTSRKDGPRRTVLMHRQILNLSETDPDVDHRDTNGLNNQKLNLRLATSIQNGQNRKKTHGSSRFKGVSWHKGSRKWRATIVINKEQVLLGYFHDELDAARVYDRFALENFRDRARLNFTNVA